MQFYKVIDTRKSDSRAVGKYEKHLGKSTGELGSLYKETKLRPENEWEGIRWVNRKKLFVSEARTRKAWRLEGAWGDQGMWKSRSYY